MNLFGYEWKKMIPKKGLLFIPLLYIYLFIIINSHNHILT